MNWNVKMQKGNDFLETEIDSQDIGAAISEIFARPECQTANLVMIMADECPVFDCAAVFYEEKGKIHVSIVSGPPERMDELANDAVKQLKKGTKVWAAVCPHNALLYFGAELNQEGTEENILKEGESWGT